MRREGIILGRASKNVLYTYFDENRGLLCMHPNPLDQSAVSGSMGAGPDEHTALRVGMEEQNVD